MPLGYFLAKGLEALAPPQGGAVDEEQPQPSMTNPQAHVAIAPQPPTAQPGMQQTQSEAEVLAFLTSRGQVAILQRVCEVLASGGGEDNPTLWLSELKQMEENGDLEAFFRGCRGTTAPQPAPVSIAVSQEEQTDRLEQTRAKREMIACCGPGSCLGEGGPTKGYFRHRHNCQFHSLIALLQLSYLAYRNSPRCHNVSISGCQNGYQDGYYHDCLRSSCYGMIVSWEDIRDILVAFCVVICLELILAMFCCGRLDEPSEPHKAGTVRWFCWGIWPVRENKASDQVQIPAQPVAAADPRGLEQVVQQQHQPVATVMRRDPPQQSAMMMSDQQEQPPQPVAQRQMAFEIEQTSNPMDRTVAAANTDANTDLDLTQFLSVLSLGKYESGLVEIGVSHIEHLVDVVAEDLQEVGMKPVEQRRFLKSVAKLADDSGSV